MNKHLVKNIDSGNSFWTFVVLMAMVFSLSPFAIDMYLPAIPGMATFFETKIDAIEASVSIYLIFFALGQLVVGAFSDSINKAKILLVGLVIFTISSAMIGLSADIGEMYFWRGVQAFAGGSSVVVFPLIHNSYDSKQSNQIISYVMACVVIAPMIAPMIGSQILVFLGWQWIFYVLAILGIFTTIFQLVRLPAKKVTDSLKPLNISNLLKGYRMVLTNKQALVYVFAGGSAFAGMFAFIAGSPFVYIEHFKVTPVQFGWLVDLNAFAMMTMNIINGKILKNIDPTKKLSTAGYLLAVTGVYLWSVAYLQLSLIYTVIGVVTFIGLLGLTAANAISAALSVVGKNTGVLSGVNGVFQFSLGALSSAVVSISESVDATTMNSVMAVCGVATLVFVSLLKRQPRSQVSQELG